MEIGGILRQLRRNAGDLTLKEVSDKTGISVSFLSDLERGKTMPSVETLDSLAKFYNVSIATLLQVEEEIDKNATLPTSFIEFRKKNKDLDQGIVALLPLIERRSKKKFDNEEVWLEFYYAIKTLLN